MKFKKKPVEIEAVQWTGKNVPEIMGFMPPEAFEVNGDCLIISTLEGDHKANPNDWIIKGVKGEFYPCKPDIFDVTYDSVPPDSGSAVPEIPVKKLQVEVIEQDEQIEKLKEKNDAMALKLEKIDAIKRMGGNTTQAEWYNQALDFCQAIVRGE